MLWDFRGKYKRLFRLFLLSTLVLTLQLQSKTAYSQSAYPNWDILRWDGPILITGCHGFEWNGLSPMILVAARSELTLFELRKSENPPEDPYPGYQPEPGEAWKDPIWVPNFGGVATFKEGDPIGEWAALGGTAGTWGNRVVFQLVQAMMDQEFYFLRSPSPADILRLTEKYPCPNFE